MAPAIPNRLHTQPFWHSLFGFLFDAKLAVGESHHPECRSTILWVVSHRKSISGLQDAGLPCEVVVLEHPNPW